MMKNAPLILVVDDMIQNVELVEAHLGPQGYATITATSGAEALRKMFSNHVDLVLLDVMMPGMSGIDVLEKIRSHKETRRVPVIMVTVLRETEDRVKAFEKGCDDFITKPFDAYELVARVKSLLRIKFLNDEVDEAREYAESVINTIREPLIALDQDLRVVNASRAFYEFFKVKSEETVGQLIYDLGNKQWDIPKLRDLLETILPQKTTFDNYEVEHVFATIGRRIMLLNARQIQRGRGKERIILLAIEDATERRQAEEQIQHMVLHDSLTGLPNRKLFSDRLCLALAQAERDQQKVGIAMLDLDNFKEVNDTFGHDAGDLLLKAAAERLSAAPRKGDTVARFGGDEFVLILPGLEAREDAVKVGRKIVEHFQEPFLIDTHQFTVTTSIGIAVYPDDGKDEGILMKNADIAMYQAKQTGGGRCRLCNKAEVCEKDRTG